MTDDPLDVLFENDETGRIEFLESFDQISLDDGQWLRTPPYFRHTLDDDSSASATERRAAIEAAVWVPVHEVRDMVESIAESGPIDERAAAGMALARVRDNSAGRAIVAAVGATQSVELRRQLAESLLLVDTAPVSDRVKLLMRNENDATTQLLLAGAYCNGGGAVDPGEFSVTDIPEWLSGRVHIGERDDGHSVVRVDPILEPTVDVGFIDVAGVPGVDAGFGPTTEDTDSPVITVLGGFDGSHGDRAVRAASPSPPPPSAAPMPTATGPGGDPDPTPAGRTTNGPPRRRFLHTRAPEAAVVDEVVPIMVRVALEEPEIGVGVGFDLDVPPAGTTLRVVVSAQGFDVGGPALQILDVPHAENSAWLLFDITGRSVGSHTVTVSLFHGEGRQLAESTHQISVTPTAVSTTMRDGTASISAMGGAPGETSLTIDWLQTENRYRFQLIDNALPPEVLSDVYTQPPSDIVETLAGDLNEIAGGAYRPADVRAWMRDLGIRLWAEMIPDALKAQFWERHDRITSLRIIARRDPFPWELLYPVARGRDDQAFLVERFPVFRGVRGRGPVASIGAGSVVTVVPAVGSPPAAGAEANSVRDRWPADATAKVHVTDLATLRATIDSGDFGVLHFACHNTFDASAADGSTIGFGNERFTPLALARAEVQESFEPRRPLVFMNACRAGSQAPTFTRIGGWASSFLNGGAGAFISPLWNVRDGSSARFADTFYDRLTAGESLAEAVDAARASIMSESDPTWLAYSVYGDPSATLATATAP